ncbi:MAG: ATP-dependent DNA helicase [Candidatus Korarchaeota archaeon]
MTNQNAVQARNCSGENDSMKPHELFPYSFRTDQKKLLEDIYDYAKMGATILLHAPAGYGKTIVVLSALLPIALEEDKTIIWAVRTGNETDRPIEELRAIIEKTKLPIYGISIRGKKDMCLLARKKGILDHEGVTVLCDKMRNKCPFFSGLKLFRSIPDKPLTFTELLDFAATKKVCPYYYQLRTIPNARLVSVNYNYVFSPSVKWALMSYVDFKDSILVVDEAHNLQHVMANVNSDKITIGTVDRAIDELRGHAPSHVELLQKVMKLREILIKEGESIPAEDDVFDPIELIEGADINEDDFETAWEIVDEIYARKIAKGVSPRSSLRHLFDFLETAIKNRGKRGIAFIKSKEKNQYAFEVWDMRASEVLKRVWRLFSSRVFMSGTLEPLDEFAEVVGVSSYRKLKGTFPIPKENVLALILEGVTTRGEELPDDMVDRYVDCLKRILQAVNVNTAIFFASYRIMNRILPKLLDKLSASNKYVIIEREEMRGDEAKRALSLLREKKNVALFASISGRFAEGVDLPGETLDGIITVGIPFERLTVRTIVYMEYYKELYGDEKGVYYSYVLPALRKVAQSMGRAIRSPNDRAFIVAADERFSERRNFELLPEFFRKYSKKVDIDEALELLTSFLS